MTIHLLFWDTFLIVWYWQALSGEPDMMELLFPLVHVVVGIGITYTEEVVTSGRGGPRITYRLNAITRETAGFLEQKIE